MNTGSLSEARSAVVKERVLEGVASLLSAGEDITFARVAKAAKVPERTVYRHFPTREALLAAVFEWANRRIGFEGELPRDRTAATELVRQVFPGFDDIAPVIRELLVTPEGLMARLSRLEARQDAAIALVDTEAPGLDRASARRVAAATQVLSTAAAWQTLRDFWQMDGKEAGETAALAIELLLDGAKARAASSDQITNTEPSERTRNEPAQEC
jgi:AcrR family transcriptional regulator